jgi:hypothetical protein
MMSHLTSDFFFSIVKFYYCFCQCAGYRCIIILLVTRKLGMFVTNAFPAKGRGFRDSRGTWRTKVCGGYWPGDGKMASVQKRADVEKKKCADAEQRKRTKTKNTSKGSLLCCITYLFFFKQQVRASFLFFSALRSQTILLAMFSHILFV